MRAFAARFAAAALCILFAHAAAHARQMNEDGSWANGVGEPWRFESHRYTAEQAAAARALWERIGDEAPDDGWAGDYEIDMSVRSHFLRWSPKGFVFFNVNTCTANVGDLNYGEAVADSPTHFEADSMRGALKFVKVKWGEQRYLIEDARVSDFCDYVAGLGAYNRPGNSGDAGFFERRGDGERPTALLPTVPPEYRQYVRRPIDARVTRVGRSYVEVNPEGEWWDELVTPVRVDAGSDHGLRRGMTLHVLDSDEFDERVELTRVGTNYSLGIVVRSVRKRPGVKLNQWDDGRDETPRPVTVGWRLTTSVHRQLLRSDARSAAWEAKQGKR